MTTPAPARAPRSKPGSVAWMLTYQIRWAWRKLTGTQRSGLALLAVILLILVGVGYANFGGALSGAGMDWTGPLPAALLVPFTLVTLFVFPLMVSQAIGAALEALFTRGDLDLLLQSPVDPRAVLASRTLGVIFAAALSAALICVPLILIAGVLGLWRGVPGVLLWWLNASMFAACLGLWVTLGLVAVIGVRRTRTVAGMIAALTGAGLFLVFQWHNMFGDSANTFVIQALQGKPGGGFWPAPDSPLWYPVRTAWAEPLPALLVTLGSAALLTVTVLALTRQFTAGVQEFADRGVQGQRRTRTPHTLRFRSGVSATLFKEWRLIWRDPELLSRTLLQLVYMIPLLAPAFRLGKGNVTETTAVGVILLAGTLSATLANLTLNAEDAPDLLRSAPRSPAALNRDKWLAAVLPVLVLGGTGLALLTSRGALSGLTGVSLVLLFLLSVAGNALMVLWTPLPVRRADLFKTPPKPGLLSILLSLIFQLGLVGAAFAVVAAHPLGWYALLAALVALGAAWARRRMTPEE